MNLAILKPQSLTSFPLQKDLGFECLNDTESFHTLSALQFDTKLPSPYAAMFKRASAAYIVRCVKRLHCVSLRLYGLFSTRSVRVQCRQHLTFTILKLVVGALSKCIQIENLHFFSLARNFPRRRRDASRVL